jgi:hypothetical protein
VAKKREAGFLYGQFAAQRINFKQALGMEMPRACAPESLFVKLFINCVTSLAPSVIPLQQVQAKP